MAIAFVNVSVGFETGYAGSPVEATLDAGSSSDRCIVVAVFCASSLTNSITGCTYNGVSMSAGTELAWSTHSHFRLFWLTGAAAGSNVVSVSYSGDISIVDFVALAYSGVGSVSGDTIELSGSSGTTHTVTVSSTSGDQCVGIFEGESTGTGTTSGNERYDAAMGGSTTCRWYACDVTAAGASTGVQYTSATTGWTRKFGLSLTPAGGGGSVYAPPTLRRSGPSNVLLTRF